MPKGKTPSLIGASLGRPSKVTCLRKGPCSRCGEDIANGEACYDIPQPQKPHSATRRFCRGCFDKVIEQTRRDLALLESL